MLWPMALRPQNIGIQSTSHCVRIGSQQTTPNMAPISTMPTCLNVKDTPEISEQLQTWDRYPHFYKLVAMRTNGDLISNDYCDKEGNVFELLHWESYLLHYNEVADKKERWTHSR